MRRSGTLREGVEVVMVSVWGLLAGCTSAPEDSTQGPAGDTASCAATPSITIDGTPDPGAVLQLRIADADAVQWSVSAGALSAPAGLETDWTLPLAVAAHTAEPLTLTAQAQACDSQTTLEDAVTVDWRIEERVMVLHNPSVEGSASVASHYAEFRGIPDENHCAIATEADTTLEEEDFEPWLAALEDCLAALGPHIQYLVPVYGTPYRVKGRIALSSDLEITTVSLDALAALPGQAASAQYAIYNPLYQDGDSPTQVYDPYVPFGELRAALEAEDYGTMLLVARIDGASAEAAMELVDRTAEAEALAQSGALSGTVYVDGRYGDTPPKGDEWGSYDSGEWNMWGTRYRFEDLGWYPVVWDGNEAEYGTEPAPTWCEDALYYAGWYSYSNYNDAFQWAPGAIGGHLDSCSACDIRGPGTWSGGALQAGITATFGAVAEPYVAGMPEYDQFFTYLTQGATFAEAGYESTVIGLWMMTWVGDPLYRPYP